MNSDPPVPPDSSTPADEHDDGPAPIPPTLTRAQRARFDQLLEDVLDTLPERIRDLIEEVPVIVLDEPTPDMIRSLKADGVIAPDEHGLDLCGLHTGIGLTDRSIEDPAGWGSLAGQGSPEQIHLFRRGIADLAGGFDDPNADDHLYEEIRITLLHELGHHFGLDEDDLDNLGYA